MVNESGTPYSLFDIIDKNRLTEFGQPGRAAVRFGDQALTYQELADRSRSLAIGLAGIGVEPGARVAVLMHNNIEWFEVLFALALRRAVLVPVNYYLTAREVAHIVADSQAAHVIAQADLWSLLDDIPGEVRRVSVAGAVAGATTYSALFGADPAGELPGNGTSTLDDVLTIMYTSGTTGRSKGAVHTHGTVLWNTFYQIPECSITRDDVALVVPALCWGAGFHDLTLPTLWAGGTVVVHPSTGFTIDGLAAAFADHGVTIVLLVPTILRRLLREAPDPEQLRTIRAIYTGAEPAPRELILGFAERYPNVSLIQVYGLSEFPSFMLRLDSSEALTRAGSAGRACLIAKVRIVDDEGRDVAEPHVPGEIICRSPATMKEYFRLPDATAETLKDGWLHTGDLGYFDADGYVYICGRKKDMIISGGLNVYPAEIEEVLVQHQDVAEVAVIGVPDPDWGEVVKAIVVPHRAEVAFDDGLADALISELKALVGESLAKYKAPRRYAVVAGPLPRTVSGKLQKFVLREQSPVPAR